MCQGNWEHVGGVGDMLVGEGMCLGGLIVSIEENIKNTAGVPSTPAFGLFPSFSVLLLRCGHCICVLS